MNSCNVPNCEKVPKARGFCASHYYSARARSEFSDFPECSTLSCENKVYAKNMCSGCYTRFQKWGSPELRRPVGLSVYERLMFYGWIVTDTGCWEFSGPRNPGGYGLLEDRPGRKLGTHRIAYETWVGPIPEGHVVRHKCDNPPCINPEHLEVGTHADNMADMRLRKRHPGAQGTRNSHAKLTEQDVLDIRMEYATGQTTQNSLAEFYGVSQPTIGALVNLRTWRNV